MGNLFCSCLDSREVVNGARSSPIRIHQPVSVTEQTSSICTNNIANRNGTLTTLQQDLLPHNKTNESKIITVQQISSICTNNIANRNGNLITVQQDLLPHNKTNERKIITVQQTSSIPTNNIANRNGNLTTVQQDLLPHNKTNERKIIIVQATLPEICQKSQLLEKLLMTLRDHRFLHNACNFENGFYSLTRLEPESQEFHEIAGLFSSKGTWCFTIERIEKIYNKYLVLQYKLKFLECLSRKKYVMEKTMFHGTKRNNVDSICKNNFNWRFHGTSKKKENGQGVNFAANAYFATNYGDVYQYKKVMLVAKVLVGKYCRGFPTTVIPEEGCDTTICHRQDPEVFVKYDDNTFFPAYVIYYNGFNPKRIRIQY